MLTYKKGLLSIKKDLLTKKKDLLTQKKGLLTYTKKPTENSLGNFHGETPRQIAASNSHGK